jgi:hypothetical protein
MLKCPECEAEWEAKREQHRKAKDNVRLLSLRDKPKYTTVCTLSVKGTDPFEPFKDGSGQTHYHDPNIHSDTMQCSRGHEWVNTYTSPCWCGWQRELPPAAPKTDKPDKAANTHKH